MTIQEFIARVVLAKVIENERYIGSFVFSLKNVWYNTYIEKPTWLDNQIKCWFGADRYSLVC